MKLENILMNFLVDIEADSKHGSFAGQCLDMMLKLVAPEYSHKQWNKYRGVLEFLKVHEVNKVLFSYKDRGLVAYHVLQLFSCSILTCSSSS